MTGVQNLTGSSAIQPIVTELPPQKAKVEVLKTGMGAVDHPRARSNRSLATFVGLGLIGLASMFMATPTLAQGASLDSMAATPIEIGIEAPAPSINTTDINAQWLTIALTPEQVVVERFLTGTQDPGQEASSIIRGAVAAKVTLNIPWPADAPRDFDKVALTEFLARDGEVSFKLEGDTLQLSYISDKGLRVALQGNNGVFNLSNSQGHLHFLSVNADKLTFDDTNLKLGELRDRVPVLQDIVRIDTASGHQASADEAAKTLADVQKQIADIESGATVYRSAY